MKRIFMSEVAQGFWQFLSVTQCGPTATSDGCTHQSAGTGYQTTQVSSFLQRLLEVRVLGNSTVPTQLRFDAKRRGQALGFTYLRVFELSCR